MEENFKLWMICAEGKLETTAINYSRAIHSLSRHYSSYTSTKTDIYNVNLKLLERIKNSYESDGKFAEEGHFRHGLNRAAIKAFYRYRLSHPARSLGKSTKVSLNLKYKKEVIKHSIVRRIYDFFIRHFKRKFTKTDFSGDFVGSKKQISKHLNSIIKIWKKEVHEKYLNDNPQCQRCKSKEFPQVFEKPPLASKKALKMVLDKLPTTAKHAISILNIENHFKSHLTCGDRLMILCRTCKKKEEDLKIERYHHKMPPIMRKGPQELKY